MGGVLKVESQEAKYSLLVHIFKSGCKWGFENMSYHKIDYSRTMNFRDEIKIFVNTNDINDIYKEKKFLDLFIDINLITMIFIINHELFQKIINNERKKLLNYDIILRFVNSKYISMDVFNFKKYNIGQEIYKFYKDGDIRFNALINSIKFFDGYSPSIEAIRKIFIENGDNIVSDNVYSKRYREEKKEFIRKERRQREFALFANALIRYRMNHG